MATMFMVSLGFAQQVIVQDFESGGNLGAFGGAISSIVPDPDAAGANGNVLRCESVIGEQAWQGVNIDIFNSVEITPANQTMQLDVYSLQPITIAPKVQAGPPAAPASTAAVSHTGSGWETLTVTFDQGLDGTSSNPDGVYTEFALHYNWDTGAGAFGTADDRVFYVDNLRGVEFVDPCDNGVQDGDETGVDCGGTNCDPCPAPPATPAPTPPATPDNEIISFYSDAYAQQPLNFDAGFCGFNSTEEIQIQGNNTIAYKGNACQGIQLNSPVDASTFTTINFDFYVENGTDLLGSVISLKLNQTNGPGAGDDIFLDNVLTEGSTPAIVTGQWVEVELTVNLSNFDALDEVVITAGTLSNKLYYDNFYLSGGTLSNEDFTANSFEAYPNPTYDNWTIKSANNNIQNVEIYNTLGRLVKEVSVKNTETVIDASSLQSGIYFAKVYGENDQNNTIKLIKR